MPITELPADTESLCPHCLRRIPARRIREKGAVYLKKACPEHGDLQPVLLWRDHPRPYDEWRRFHVGKAGKTPATEHPELAAAAMGKDPTGRHGCPYDCGFCTDHRQTTCSAILEVTDQCNIYCPICFAASSTEAHSNPDLSQIERKLRTIQDRAGSSCPIQLSGGEPTLRNDLPQIIALARKCGFDHIQVNTNGIRLAQDTDYGQALLDAGVTDFFLQFDGLTDDVYRRIRGAELSKLKLGAIERCAALRTGVILVPTLVRNVNETQIGAIIAFAKKWMPTVRGVHFQPMTYLGRYPSSPRNEDRIVISDILTAIEEQTLGELKIENFLPPG